jgi:hypothetical protein
MDPIGPSSQGGSSQGANRDALLNPQSRLTGTLAAITKTTGDPAEFGADRSPVNVTPVGGVEVNSANATKIVVPPEVGKGSIADVLL